MTDPIDRAAEAPRILGQPMNRHVTGGWIAFYGCVFARITEGRGYQWEVAYKSGASTDLAVCIAAIEHELLAIAAAIPTRPACTNCGGRHTSTTDEETCFATHAAIPTQRQDESDNWRWCMPGIPPESKP